jgi:hypothetical protein
MNQLDKQPNTSDSNRDYSVEKLVAVMAILAWIGEMIYYRLF